MAVPPIDRLKAQLLTSGIQKTQPQLYQVINQLIDYLRLTANIAGEDGIGPAGPPGPIGPIGPAGPSGSGSGGMQIPPFWGDSDSGSDIESYFDIPGPAGPKGDTGPMGPSGSGSGTSAPTGLIPFNDEILDIPELIMNEGTMISSYAQGIGVWFDVPYNAADFTADVGTWTVDAGDVLRFRYCFIGRTMVVQLTVQTSSTSSATATQLRVKIPVNQLPNTHASAAAAVNYGGTFPYTYVGAIASVGPGTSGNIWIECSNYPGIRTNDLTARFELLFEVK